MHRNATVFQVFRVRLVLGSFGFTFHSNVSQVIGESNHPSDDFSDYGVAFTGT